MRSLCLDSGLWTNVPSYDRLAYSRVTRQFYEAHVKIFSSYLIAGIPVVLLLQFRPYFKYVGLSDDHSNACSLICVHY